MKHQIILLLSTSLISECFSQNSPSATVTLSDSITISVIEAINRNELHTAEKIIDSQLSLDSTSLKWRFLRGMRFYADLLIFTTVNKEALAKMRQDMEQVQHLGETSLRNNPNDFVALFYVGGAYGYLGLAEAADGSLFSAVGTAKKGFNLHEKLIKQCPDCFDAYLGPGMMNLLTSDIPWILKPILWIFGLSGSEERAYEYLTIAYEHGTLVRFEAGKYLAQLFERRKEFKKSYDLYSQLIERYPMKVALRAESFTPLWQDKRYDDMITSAQDMMRVFESRQHSFTSSDSAWMPIVVNTLSNAHKLKGDTLYSISVLEDFLERSEYASIDKWRTHLTLADFYSERDPSRAIVHYRAVVASNAPESVKKGAANSIEKLNSSRK